MKKTLTNKKNPKINRVNQETQGKKLYEALIYIYKFHKLEDFLFLKNTYFLKLCEVHSIQWNFNTKWLKKVFPENKEEDQGPFQFSCPLIYKQQNYGDLIFSSFQKFPQNKKKILKKISFFTASALYFIENKQKTENIKKQWGKTFDSFSQAFCITDKNFKIIRSNQAFCVLINQTKTELFAKELFHTFPFPIQMPHNKEQASSWLAIGEKEGQKIYWEISFKPLLLKKEKIQTLLFLIKDVSQQIDIEKKLSDQVKDRDLGLIKGSIAHEINNPIAGIKALISVIEKELDPAHLSVKDTLKEMEKAIDRCHQIIKQILTVSQNRQEDKTRLFPNHKESTQSQDF